MRLAYYTLLIGFFTGLMAQVGEVSSEEIVVEKDKEIVLPNADKLYLPVEIQEIPKSNTPLTFDVRSPEFNIAPFSPQIRPYGYAVPSYKIAYQNFAKLGYGAYGSPLLMLYAGEQNKKLSWGAWLHHESFGKGSVRDSHSASSTSYGDIFATFQNRNWALTPSIGWQMDGYRFYGYADEDPRASDEKSNLQRIRLGATVEEIYDNKFSLKFSPVLKSTVQNTPENQPGNKESYFDFMASSQMSFDSTLSAGADFHLGAISFTSETSINRNFAKISPWLGIKRKNLYIKAGVQIASTNDTIISGTKSFFYPDIRGEWSGLPGWTLYASLTGDLKPVTLSSISRENLFLDDSLTMAHENIQTAFGGGIRGAINSQLHLNTGMQLSSVKNMSFFIPSSNDSARFELLVDPEATTVFNLYGQLNWQPKDGTHIGLRTDIYAYGTQNVEEAWYKPSLKLTLDWIQQFTDKISSRFVLTSIGGLKAPDQDFVVNDLQAIVDLSLEGNYKINKRAEAFVQVQNIFGAEYERFLNYPGRGIGFRIGGKYRF